MDNNKRAARKQAREERKDVRKYAKAESKIASAKLKGFNQGAKAEKKYGYNYGGAIKAGLGPDETGHWPSRNPDTGEILKGRKHPTIRKTKKAEKEMGYKITRKNGTMYSNPRKSK